MVIPMVNLPFCRVGKSRVRRDDVGSAVFRGPPHSDGVLPRPPRRPLPRVRFLPYACSLLTAEISPRMEAVMMSWCSPAPHTIAPSAPSMPT